MKWSSFSDKDLDRFRDRQRRSFEVQATVLDSLDEGDTEVAVARRLAKTYLQEGVRSFFHLPVVLFGERTALPEPWEVLGFWPTERALRPGDAVILDASPIFETTLVDTSTSMCFGGAAGYAAVVHDDLTYRTTILEAVRSGATFAEIATSVDEQLTAGGYRNCHRLHPGEVLGHRVGDVDGLTKPDEHLFAQDLIQWFVQGAAEAETTGNASPTWSDRPGSDHAPADGLWAVEPHLGKEQHGVKWEEILVIQGSEAHWLDDDPPHVRRAEPGRR